MNHNNTPHVRFLNLTVGIIALALFIVPFFWLKPGFVELGGDGGRWYFIDPLFSAKHLWSQENILGEQNQSMIPYEIVLYFIKLVVKSPTYLISTINGLILSLGFLFTCLSIRELLRIQDSTKQLRSSIAGITGGVAYISFISNQGWAQALHTHNQIFVNPMLFYLLLRFCITPSKKFGITILVVTLLASQNFGFSAMPQLMSFFPLTILFIVLYLNFVRYSAFPWKKMLIILAVFLCLHAFHVLPTIGALFGNTTLQGVVFSKDVIESYGVKYFDANHTELGKISKQLLAPSEWRGRNIVIFFIPLIMLMGFIRRPTKLQVVTGFFYLLTLFLVSANITNTGVQLYHYLFYIPGFSMFRSFNDRWYFVYVFFYALLFAFSYYELTKKFKLIFSVLIILFFISAIVIRIFPFLKGNSLYLSMYQTNNVTSVLKLDDDLTDALKFVKNIPHDGKFLTIPLTFPYYQIAYGDEGGAYRGLSLVYSAAGHSDYAGFWSFGSSEESVYGLLLNEDIPGLRKKFSELEVKYVFRNRDTRIMDDFPGYPYVYPGMVYSDKEKVPIIKNQDGYDKLISLLPLKIIFEKGFYTVYVFTDSQNYLQSTIDPNLHLYFIIGRAITFATIIYIIYGIVRKKHATNE